MIIAGLQKLTLIDYPAKVAAIVFTYGCNFFCSFCHNPELVDPKLKDKNKFISQEEFFQFLNSRKGLIEGICITGGEPTLYEDLGEFISQIKSLGFLVKLDTNGTNSEIVKDLIDKKLVDYIAMDIKAPFDRYEKITRRKADLKEIKKSIKIIMDSRLDYEFRSTLVPDFHGLSDVEEIARLIKGARNYYLQSFVSQGKILEPVWQNKRSFTPAEMEEFQEVAKPFVEKCEIRM